MVKVEIAANSDGKSTMVPHCAVEVTELHFIIVLIGHFCYWIFCGRNANGVVNRFTFYLVIQLFKNLSKCLICKNVKI